MTIWTRAKGGAGRSRKGSSERRETVLYYFKLSPVHRLARRAVTGTSPSTPRPPSPARPQTDLVTLATRFCARKCQSGNGFEGMPISAACRREPLQVLGACNWCSRLKTRPLWRNAMVDRMAETTGIDA